LEEFGAKLVPLESRFRQSLRIPFLLTFSSCKSAPDSPREKQWKLLAAKRQSKLALLA